MVKWVIFCSHHLIRLIIHSVLFLDTVYFDLVYVSQPRDVQGQFHLLLPSITGPMIRAL